MNYNMMLIETSVVCLAQRPVTRIRVCLAAWLLACSVSAVAAPADDFKEGSRLYQSGKYDQAMTKVSAGLQQQPKDAQGRFLKGLILTEQKKTADAIQVFTGLTEDFPELPEPYNNLAVLYASQGNYDKAKAALELAIHTHPSYATAYENLGDIHAQLARRAYDKALQLDKTNTTAQSKLAMVREMFGAPKSAVPVATVTTTSPAATATTAASAAAVTAPIKPATPASANQNDNVKATVTAWANAWSSKDVASYLSYYAADFETPGDIARGAWEVQRRDRIERPKSIRVDVAFKSVIVKGNDATVVFRQSYKSDTVNSNNTKTLRMTRVGEKWLIKTERAGG